MNTHFFFSIINIANIEYVSRVCTMHDIGVEENIYLFRTNRMNAKAVHRVQNNETVLSCMKNCMPYVER